jgi:hypothetical protein
MVPGGTAAFMVDGVVWSVSVGVTTTSMVEKVTVVTPP